jgi:ribosome-binding protein aMBF1 (putative translation factor)
MTGPDLKRQRERYGIKVKHLAARMAVGPTRIPQIEGQAAVSEEMVTRYLAALIGLASEANVSA